MRVGIMHLMMCLHHLRQTSLANPTRVHLEGQLTDDDMHFTGQHSADFMAKVESFKKKKIKHSKNYYKCIFPQLVLGRGLSLTSSTPVFAQQDVLLSGSVTDEGIVPAQFLCADGLSVPLSIKTSELNTLVCNMKHM